MVIDMRYRGCGSDLGTRSSETLSGSGAGSGNFSSFQLQAKAAEIGQISHKVGR